MVGVLSLTARPRIKRHVIWFATPEYLFIRADEASFRIKSTSVPDLTTRLLPLLDGVHTIREIVDSLGDYRAEGIISFLEKLFQMGLLDIVSHTEGKLSLDANLLSSYLMRFGDPTAYLQ